MPTKIKYPDFKLYVGCGLTHASEKFKKEVQELKDELSKVCPVLDFLGVVNGTPHDVYVHDIINCVGSCDLMAGICDEPSTGLGWEMATQVLVRKKPLLAFGHEDTKITRLVLDPQLPGYEFIRYKNFFQVYDKIVEKVKEISEQRVIVPLLKLELNSAAKQVLEISDDDSKKVRDPEWENGSTGM